MRIWEVFSSLFTEGGMGTVSYFRGFGFYLVSCNGQTAAVRRARPGAKNVSPALGKSRLFRKNRQPPLRRAVTKAFAEMFRCRTGIGAYGFRNAHYSTHGLRIVDDKRLHLISPLLGLLGTISGMNEMFSIIGAFGFGSPSIMASGISMALKATLTGLAVAVVALFLLDP